MSHHQLNPDIFYKLPNDEPTKENPLKNVDYNSEDN